MNPFFNSRNVEPHDFASVEDMLFEVFRCEETDTIDSISISQFFKVSFSYLTVTFCPCRLIF